MTDDLTTITTPRSTGPMRFEATIPTGWEQGRGAFGGLVIGTLVRAIEAAAPQEGRALRSITAQLCGPVIPGPAAIAVEVLRRGSGVSTLAARLSQGEDVSAYAVGVLGRDRSEGPARLFVEPPSPPPWRDVPEVTMDHAPSPGFARSFEYRNVGPAPFSGGSSPIVSGWIRSRRPGPARDAAYVAALVDAYWPTIFSIMPAPRPIGTVAFALDFAGTCDGLDPEAPLFFRAHTASERGGYVVEIRELWGEDGRLIAINQQTIVLIR